MLSAGLSNDAGYKVSAELIEWAELIFVMEKAHQAKLRKKFKPYLNDQRVIVLEIPDIYDFMEPSLIEELSKKLSGYIGAPVLSSWTASRVCRSWKSDQIIIFKQRVKPQRVLKIAKYAN